MFALFLLAALAGVVYLMVWAIMNDGAKRIEDQTGLLRMTPPKGAAAPSAEEPKTVPRHGRGTRPLGEPFTGRWTPRPGRPQPTRLQTDHLQTGRPLQGRAKPAAPAKAPAAAPSPAPASEAEAEIIHPLWQGRRRPGQRR